MIIKTVTQVGNSVIRSKAKAIKNTSAINVRKTIKNLVDSMRYHDLVGMAAPQIGKGLRIFVTEIRKTKFRSPKVIDRLRIYINPNITSASKRTVSGYEGCGSVADANFFGKVNRSQSVTVLALDEKGERFELKASGLLARVIQHEHDHIDGYVFLDKLTDKKSLMSGSEYRKRFKR